MNIPKVSIITPSYNQGQYIEETIKSILNQTYNNIEYIIIDGGSNDQTMDIVKKYSDRIDVIIHEKDKGQSDAINKGFKIATGELVGWINSDDILYPTCVEEIVNLYLQKSDGAIYYTSTIDIINSSGEFIKKYTNVIPNKDYLVHRKYSVCQQGSFYSRQILMKANYIDESINYCMDLDLWLRLLNYGPIYRIDNESYAALREWETTKTATGGIKFLREIRKTVIKNGASYFDPTVRLTMWYHFKHLMKSIL